MLKKKRKEKKKNCSRGGRRLPLKVDTTVPMIMLLSLRLITIGGQLSVLPPSASRESGNLFVARWRCERSYARGVIMVNLTQEKDYDQCWLKVMTSWFGHHIDLGVCTRLGVVKYYDDDACCQNPTIIINQELQSVRYGFNLLLLIMIDTILSRRLDFIVITSVLSG